MAEEVKKEEKADEKPTGCPLCGGRHRKSDNIYKEHRERLTYAGKETKTVTLAPQVVPTNSPQDIVWSVEYKAREYGYKFGPPTFGINARGRANAARIRAQNARA